MEIEIPELIAIDHDDYHARHIGRTADGNQFFLTTPFVPAHKDQSGHEFIALYLFDSEGKLIEARIDDFGARENLDEEKRRQYFEQRLSEIEPVEYERIEIRPFSVERFGVTFGLIPLEPEDEDDLLSVCLEPGNYMAFYEPWDSGEYDT